MVQKDPSSFSLHKWYLDAADRQENIYIGYWICLNWKSISLYGFQHLWHSPNSGTREKTWFSQIAEPQELNDALVWNTTLAQALWRTSTPKVQETLIDSSEGKIIWNCTHPKADASITLPSFSFSGPGYAEHISLTLPPWKLPFTTLWWGRCHSKNHYLIWIQWKGDEHKNLLWLDGKQTSDFRIRETSLEFPEGTLSWQDKVSLRQGNTISHIAALNSLVSSLPGGLLSAFEDKRYALGNLIVGNESEPATIIYEKVIWQ